jgi:predicted aspartyl protease
LILVSLIGPHRTHPTEGLLDTGADDTVFPERLAASIGLDLTNAPIGQATTANLANAPLRYAQVHLRITDGKEQREWPAWVGFTPAKLQLPLLGFASFLQFFTATFHGDYERVELTVNNLYPGT